MHALPIPIPNSLFHKLRSLQIKFVWTHRRPHIKLQLIIRLKALENMGLPNLQLYYSATHLTRVIDWHCHSAYKDWVQLESETVASPLHFIWWVPWASCSSLKAHPLIGNTLKIFHNMTNTHNLCTIPGPLSPLSNNPDFPPGQNNPHLHLTNDRILLALLLLKKGKSIFF